MKHLKILILGLMLVCHVLPAPAQEKATIYNPEADAKAELKAAVAKAAADHKYVFVQVGGNWCPWCVKFHNMVSADASLDSLLKANYEVVHINYSKENKNLDLLATLGYPQRFGFPVFLVLDGEGKLLHTQDSGLLEQDKGYSREKVQNFFRMWSAATLQEAKQKFGVGK